MITFDNVKPMLEKFLNYCSDNDISFPRSYEKIKGIRTYRGLEQSICNHELNDNAKKYGLNRLSTGLVRDWMQVAGIGDGNSRYPNIELVHLAFPDVLAGEYDFFVEEVNKIREKLDLPLLESVNIIKTK